jgi:UDP-N-acetylmuramoyl-tripeptide--D-alanyl-D-alanine ligase
MKFLGATFIDDTYNSNPLSLNSALEVMENLHSAGRKVVVMGDMLELGQDSISLHRKAVKKARDISDILITVGELSNSACRLIKPGVSKKIFICDSSLQARECLLNKVFLKKDDVVLVKGSRGMKMERVFE